MSQSAAVLEDRSLLSALDRALLRLESFFALISGIAVFSLMIMAVVSVSGRSLFNRPLPGYVDWVEAAMPLIAFMGIAYVQRSGNHIRMDIVPRFLKGRMLWFTEFLGVVFIFLLMSALVWGSWAHFARSFDWNAPLWSRDSSIDIGIPLWPAKLLVPIAFSLLCLRSILQIWGYSSALLRGSARPIAVPLVQDAAAQAMSEAEQLRDRV
ncbi:MAG: TRAP transporter small permease [Aestuariivita sp.]|nr:TRAP transporter small permease [Aestuariivita sp.]MCY4347731.1 TRAP transporter small permease [Aestuariivita sp.]